MKSIVMIAVMLFCGVVFAQDADKEPADLTALQKSYVAAVKQVTQPLTKTYLQNLDTLKKKYGAAGDIKNAVLVQNEIDKIGDKNGSAEVAKPVATVMTYTDFVAEYEKKQNFPKRNNLLAWKNVEASAAQTHPTSSPETAFQGRRTGNDWGLGSATDNWFLINLTSSVRGRYILLFGRGTPPGSDQWGDASIQVNDEDSIPIHNMSGSMVVIVDLQKVVAISKMRIAIKRGTWFPGLVGVEIHTKNK